jgi:large subunit ribosomal protein L13
MNIDGKNAILGRLASFTAKRLLAGEAVNIVNAENIIITGSDPKKIVGAYLKKRRMGSPQHGPFFPRKPDMIVRRTIRSMLPYKTNRGRAAFKRLKVYIGVPEELKNEKFESRAATDIKTNYVSVGKVAKALGWNE